MDARQVSAPILAAILAVYLAPHLTSNPPLAFYCARGLLGCLCLYGLWRGWRITLPAMLVAGAFEAGTSVCGALYCASASLAFGGLCDKGTGLPLTLPALTGAVVAALLTIGGNNNDRGS